MIGQTVSHYRVVEKIGGGGMGVVYRAEDTRLGRQVALKFLPDHVAADPAALERFRREARAASAINHPHICTVYDIGEQDGKPFLAMEFLEGSTLKDRIAAGPVPLSSVLEWGGQIVDALEAAHAAGIVHRDLKPANLFITTRGQVKVLDFGLAKVNPQPAVADTTLSMALTATMTVPGTTLGTIGYMSPEQARGEDLDGRTDLFSFGAVLYEMATGKQAFDGRTPAMVFNAILSVDPPAPSAANPALPPEFDQIVLKALSKDVDARYQKASDLAHDLQALRHDTTVAHIRATAGPKRGKTNKRLYIGAAAAVLVVGAGFTGYSLLQKPKAPAEMKLKKLTANPSERSVSGAVLSQDGRYLVYSDPGGVRLLTLATNESRLLPGTTNMTLWGWTPAGDKVIAMRQDPGQFPKAFYVPVIGGGEVQEAPWAVPSPDGKRLIEFRAGGEMWLRDVGGGNARAVHHGASPNFAWSPDGTLLALIAPAKEGVSIIIQQVATGTNQTVFGPARGRIASIEFAARDRIIYSQSEPPPAMGDFNLWDIYIDPASGERRSEPGKLTQWEGYFVSGLSASENGKLAFVRATGQTDVYVAGSDFANEPRRLTMDDRNDQPHAWTADSKSVIFASDRNGSWDIFRQTLDADSPQAIASGPERQTDPVLAPDGKSVFFVSRPPDSGPRDGATLMSVPVEGGLPREIAKIERFHAQHCVPTGCILETFEGRDERSVWELDPVKGKGKLLFKRTGGTESMLSPDGKYAAYSPGKPNMMTNLIRVIRLSDGKIEKEINVKDTRFLTSLAWHPDGKSFYAGAMIVSAGAAFLRVGWDGKSKELWQQAGTRSMWGVPSPDGRHVALYGSTRDSNVWLLEGY